MLCRGNIDSANLTSQERKQLRKRIGNRESARRMRDRKLEHDQRLRSEVRLLEYLYCFERRAAF